MVERIHEAGGGQPQGLINVDHGDAPHIKLEVRLFFEKQNISKYV